MYVAVFAVSSYNATIYRHECKPYTPLLGETYECIRKDKGFRFIAEKVGHHPTVCTSYVESNNYTFSETITLCTKFWGKSVEFVPKGKSIINLRQPTTNEKTGAMDCYEWNKVTTCVQNVFGPGKRYLEHYGEMVVKNFDNRYTCKVNFNKSSYWSSLPHVVTGTVFNNRGNAVRKFSGQFTDAIHLEDDPTTPIWRPNPMPDNHEDYYGFTYFAMELNELNDNLA